MCPRSGFSLVELLVSIAIIATILGLVVSGFLSPKDVNRVLATEQLIADLVRQARHTARSSGEPVELRILQTTDTTGMVVGGHILGVSRQSIWSQSFDDPRNMGSVGGAFSVQGGGGAWDPDPNTGLTLGRTGNGVWPATSTVSSVNHAAMLVHPLSTSQNLVRGQDPVGQSDGFSIACAVRPPAASAAWTAWAQANPGSNSTTGTEIPLVILGGPDGPIPATCIAGLTLVLTHLTLSIGPGQSQSQFVWDLRGWVNVPGPSPATVMISSLSAIDMLSPSGGPAWPIGGERWEDFGLLYDGYSLTLTRNGNALHATGTGLPLTVPMPAAVLSHVLVSPAQEVVYIGESLPAGTAITTYADAPLDDVRLMRLGTEQPMDLPPTVVPETPGTLVFRPDGTTSFTPDTRTTAQAGALALNPLVLAQPAQGATGAVTISTAQGMQQVTPSGAPAPGMLVFCRRIKGVREIGELQAGLVQVPLGNGSVQSWLGSIGLDSSSPPVTYLVYSTSP